MKIFATSVASLITAFLINGCAQKPLCLKETIGPGSPEGAASPVVAIKDLVRDFNLDHPVFEEHLDVRYESFDAVPQALDIKMVEVERTERRFCWRITTAEGGIPTLLEEFPRTARFGVFLDTDLNGAADLLITMTGPSGTMMYTPGFEVIDESSLAIVEDRSIVLCAPYESVGDRFDWGAFTGYSPRGDAYYRTPVLRKSSTGFRYQAVFMV